MLVGKSVLLVEDVRAMRVLIHTALRSFGMDVAEAADGAEALEILGLRDFQFVITDLLMEPVDGISLIRTLRTPETGRPLTHIIALSGHADVSSVKTVYAAGASDFVVKPIVPNVLKSRLERLLTNPPAIVRRANYHGPDRRRRTVYYPRLDRRQASQVFTELD
jgi:two-component system chemotaxis response regulator CheY